MILVRPKSAVILQELTVERTSSGILNVQRGIASCVDQALQQDRALVHVGVAVSIVNSLRASVFQIRKKCRQCSLGFIQNQMIYQLESVGFRRKKRAACNDFRAAGLASVDDMNSQLALNPLIVL